MILNVFTYLIYTISSVFGLYFLKISKMGFNLFFILGVIMYGSGFLIWLYILKTNYLSFAFPVTAGMLIIGTQLVGFLLLNESISLVKLCGIAFVAIGIMLIFKGI